MTLQGPQIPRFPRADPTREWCRNGVAGLEVDVPKPSKSIGFSSPAESVGDEDLGVLATTIFSKLTMWMGAGLPFFRSGPLYSQVAKKTMMVPRINWRVC